VCDGVVRSQPPASSLLAVDCNSSRNSNGEIAVSLCVEVRSQVTKFMIVLAFKYPQVLIFTNNTKTVLNNLKS
jgi:hypothetical protein